MFKWRWPSNRKVEVCVPGLMYLNTLIQCHYAFEAQQSAVKPPQEEEATEP
jgi:hypothetical protein